MRKKGKDFVKIKKNKCSYRNYCSAQTITTQNHKNLKVGKTNQLIRINFCNGLKK